MNKRYGKWNENRIAVPPKNIGQVALEDAASVYNIDKPGAPQ